MGAGHSHKPETSARSIVLHVSKHAPHALNTVKYTNNGKAAMKAADSLSLGLLSPVSLERIRVLLVDHAGEPRPRFLCGLYSLQGASFARIATRSCLEIYVVSPCSKALGGSGSKVNQHSHR